jgi:hypothetical protein
MIQVQDKPAVDGDGVVQGVSEEGSRSESLPVQFLPPSTPSSSSTVEMPDWVDEAAVNENQETGSKDSGLSTRTEKEVSLFAGSSSDGRISQQTDEDDEGIIIPEPVGDGSLYYYSPETASVKVRKIV